MSYHEYMISRKMTSTDPPFYALIMCAMRKADTTNAAKLRAAFPDVWNEFQARYNAPGGVLADD
jgi:hypothetical protein